MATRKGQQPIYQQVYGSVRADIESGRLGAGSRLPGSRAMAAALGVSRTVVLMAYEQLESDGYVASQGGSGTYVQARQAADVEPGGPTPMPAPSVPLVLARRAAQLRLPEPDREHPLPSAAAVIDLAQPRVRSDPRSLKYWRKTVSRLVHRQSSPDYPHVEGVPPLRQAVANYLRIERGIEVDPGNVIIVAGVQQARDLIARVFVDEGSVVGVEDPGYPGVRQSYRASGARVVPCAVDAQGLDIERHASALRDARVLNVGPSFQFPTGAVMSAERRRALLAWAYATGTCLVEDDFDSEHRCGVRAAPPLWSMDRHGRVIYVSSFARGVYPALQLGYMLVPDALRDTFIAAKWLADRGCMSMQQHILAACLESGQYLRDIRRINQGLAARHHCLREALRERLGTRVDIPGEGAAGMLYLRLPTLPHAATDEVLAEALAQGVRVRSADATHALRPDEVVLALGYAGVAISTLRLAAERLVEAVLRVESRRRHARA